MADQHLDYYENLATSMNGLSIDPDKHSAILTDSFGGFTVRSFDSESTTFDRMIDGLEKFNVKAMKGIRCLMIKSPNRILREFGGSKVSMLTYCAPRHNDIQKNNGIKGESVVSEDYLVPDKRNVLHLAAIVKNNETMMKDAIKAALDIK